MGTLPTLITDLALILVLAGIVSLIFRRLKQPLVLGYIVAGFICGPQVSFFPSVVDAANVSTWADIGVIFLMFTLGLEFSFKKIFKMGSAPFIAACTIIFCMIGLGSVAGHFFGWSDINSLFLGGMLAMSSTTVIYKALNDMGLRQQRFASSVMSVLVVEDILGILLMVLLSTIAVSSSFQGMKLVASLLQLALVLVVWFVVGVFMIPSFLRQARKWMSKETLLIMALGLCFLMVVLAEEMHYSSAFGAFMMGSILAETIEAEEINRLVEPVKDLFGAIFFVSVGMLVNPSVIASYWLPILILIVLILPPVSVSVITTFLTPYMIRLAEPVYYAVEKHMPSYFRSMLNNAGNTPSVSNETAWKRLLRSLFKQVAAYGFLSVAVITVSFNTLLPFSREVFTHWWGNAFCGIVTLMVISPFLRAIVMRKNHSDDFKKLWNERQYNRFPLIFTIVVRYIFASAFVFYIINFLSPYSSLLHWILACVLVLVFMSSKSIKARSIKLEHSFMRNLNLREAMAVEKGKANPKYAERLLSLDVHMTHVTLPMNTVFAGKTLKELDLARQMGVMVAAISRSGSQIHIPGPNEVLFPGDVLQIIGDDVKLKTFAQRVDSDTNEEMEPDEAKEMILRSLLITDNSLFCNKRVNESGIREQYQCMLAGFQDKDAKQLTLPHATRVIRSGDIMWIVGERTAMDKLWHEECEE